jgi:hypothetical protein
MPRGLGAGGWQMAVDRGRNPHGRSSVRGFDCPGLPVGPHGGPWRSSKPAPAFPQIDSDGREGLPPVLAWRLGRVVVAADQAPPPAAILRAARGR